MEKQNLWNLFKETGKIEYYIKYKIFIKCMHFTQFLQWKKLQTSTNDT